MTIGSLQRRRDLALSSGAELLFDTPLEIVDGERIYLGLLRWMSAYRRKQPLRIE